MYDSIIIGGGIAGITAAIYAVRRKLNTLIITTDLGGQLGKINEIENWPGEEKISGPELSMNLMKQINKFQIEVKYAQAIRINKDKDAFTVTTSQESISTKSLILAFGKVPRTLDIKGEQELMGRGVSYCATCDAPFFKNKVVAVMGGGNSALDAAILLSKIAQKVYLIHRRTEFRAEQHLTDQLSEIQNIEPKLGCNISEVKGTNKLEKIILDNKEELPVDGLFIEAGFIVNNGLVKDLVDCNDSGSIVTDKNQATSCPGIFAAGDMTDHPYQQLVIAAGQGATAALSAYDYIQKNKS